MPSPEKVILDERARVLLEKRRLLERMAAVLNVVENHCAPSVVIINSEQHVFELGRLRRRLVERKPRIEKLIQEIDHSDQLDDDGLRKPIVERLRRVLYTLYFSEEPNLDCILDD